MPATTYATTALPAATYATALPATTYATTALPATYATTALPVTTTYATSAPVYATTGTTSYATNSVVGVARTPQVVGTVVNTAKEVIKGESRIEYVPFEKKIVEYR